MILMSRSSWMGPPKLLLLLGIICIPHEPVIHNGYAGAFSRHCANVSPVRVKLSLIIR